MKRQKAFFGREAVIGGLILAIVVVLGVATPGFLRWENIKDIFVNVSYVTIAALGMTMIIITGGIDISMGAMLALLSLCCGQMAKVGLPVAVYIPLTLLLGAAFSGLNGFIIVKLRVPPMICTLAVSSIFRGGIILVTKGSWIHNLPESFNWLGKGYWLGVPASIWVMAAVLAWAVVFLGRTRLGRNIYTVGGNPAAARLAGINCDGVLMATYAISGALMAISSIVYATRFSTVQTDAGQGFEMQLIAAALIGGTNILGGSGHPVGTFLGALLLGVIRTALVFLRVSTYWEQAVQGTLILLAVLLGLYEQVLRRRKEAKEAANHG